MNVPNIISMLDAETARHIKSYPHPTNRASEAGHPCARFLVLSRLEPDKKALHDVGLQRIFDEGAVHEAALMRELQDAGLTLIEQQRYFSWPKFELTGRIDAKIAVNGSYLPLEIKSCSPHIFPAVKEMAPADLLTAKHSWLRKYPAQILLYMLMDGKDTGLMIFKNKTSGEKCMKVFGLTDPLLEYTETVLKKLEVVNGYVARGEIPPLEPCDECRGCGFEKTVCFPGRDYGPGYDFLTDTETEEKLIRWADLKPAAKEFEGLDEELKEQFKGKTAIVGDFMVESKEYQRKNYDVPADIKKPFERISTYWKTKIERLGS